MMCFQVFCSRYVNEHMVLHGVEANHLLSLSFLDLSVWCYGCESYVHNEVSINCFVPPVKGLDTFTAIILSEL